MRPQYDRNIDSDKHPSTAQLQRYLRTLLSGSGEADPLVESHLQECANCRRRLQDEIDAEAMRAALDHDEMPATAGLTTRVREDRKTRGAAPFPVAVAAMAILAVGVISILATLSDRLPSANATPVRGAPAATLSRSMGKESIPMVSREPVDTSRGFGSGIRGLTPAPSAPTQYVGRATGPSETTLPQPAPSTPPKRIHTVLANDTLSGLAIFYYGDPSRWPVILEANKEVQWHGKTVELRDDGTNLQAGMTLVIPWVDRGGMTLHLARTATASPDR